MESVLAIVIGVLVAAGIYMMLRRSIVKLLIGVALIGQAANLLVFTSAGLTRGTAPLVPEGALEPAGVIPDPLPQALVLTAIVIGFAVLAFTVVLIHRGHETLQTDDLDRMREPPK